MGTPYRDIDESSDREGAALLDLGQRRSRLRARILFAFLIVGVALGVPGYLTVREAQFALANAALPILSAALGFFVPLFGAGAAGHLVARRAVQARTSRWLDELAARYKVKRERLCEVVELVHAAERG